MSEKLQHVSDGIATNPGMFLWQKLPRIFNNARRYSSQVARSARFVKGHAMYHDTVSRFLSRFTSCPVFLKLSHSG
jgi:hypothetical protein